MADLPTQNNPAPEQEANPIRWWTVGLWAAGIALLAMLPTMIQYKGLYVIRGDFTQLFMPVIIESKRLLSTGYPLWSHNTGLGAGAGALVSGSPFFWLQMLVPEKWLPWAIGYSVILKFAAASCFSFLALRLFVSSRSAAIGALLYTFSGYCIINTQFLTFTDVLAVFPLLVLGVESVFRNNKHGFALFTVAVSVNILASFYLFAASSLFITLYIVCRLVGVRDYAVHRLKWLMRILASYVLGIGISGLIVFPKISIVIDSARATLQQGAGIKHWLIYEPLRYFELIRVFFMPSEGLVRHAFYPYTSSWTSTGIYLPVFGFALVFIYFTRYKGWLSRLIILCLAMSFVPFLNASFSGFTNALYTRWWFALAFLLALASSIVIDQRRTIEPTLFRGYFLISLAISAVLSIPFGVINLSPGILLKFNAATGLTLLQWWFELVTSDPFMGGASLVIAAWLLCLVNYLLLWFILFRKTNHTAILICVSIAAAVNLGVFVELNNRDRINMGVPSAEATNLGYVVDRAISCQRDFESSQKYIYRADYPHEMRNYGMYSNTPSPNVFISTRSSNIAQFEKLTGCSEIGAVTSLMPYDRPALRSLLSVKYFVNYDPKNFELTMPGYDLVQKTANTDIYENQYYVPMGFSYDTYISESRLSQYSDCIEKVMLKAVVLSDKQIAKYGSDMHQYDADAKNCADFDWMADAENMKKHTCTDYVGDSRGFEARIKLRKPKMVFFSIPYGAGWSAYVDGKPETIEKVNTGFLGLMVSAGQHDIVFRYFPPGLKSGAIVSGISIVVLMCYFIVSARISKRKLSGELVADSYGVDLR